MLFYPLYYGIISLTSLKVTQAFRLLPGSAEDQRILKFKITQITEGLDNGDSDAVLAVEHSKCDA